MNSHPRLPPVRSLHPRRILGHLKRKLFWWMMRKGTDAAMCHYPGIETQLRLEGYQKPILVQTQLGVDEQVFFPSESERTSTRKKLELEGFVVGFVGRITEEKGIFDIAAAMERLPQDTQLLVVGDGNGRSKLVSEASSRGWGARLRIVGQVPLNDVAVYMRAMDCLVIGSRAIEGWVDTFPLVVAQAMTSALPVVGSTNGAIPYQLGGRGLLYPEGDVGALVQQLIRLYGDGSLRMSIGRELRTRALEEFCTLSMNRRFHEFLTSVVFRESSNRIPG